MTIQEMMNKIRQLLEDSKAGVLATVAEDGYPHMRWMTPVLLDEWPDALFAVTSPGSLKAAQLGKDTKVEWLLQGKTLQEVVVVKGRINLIDNPSVKANLMETVGQRLAVFWKINPNTDSVVLETVIEEASLFIPMKNERHMVKFSGGDADRDGGENNG